MNQSHFAGLDAWRAALLIGGIFYHGTMLQQAHLAFDLVEVASTAFRTAAFFAVAGFLAALSLRRRDTRRWIAARSLKIGVPALFGITFLSPLIWAMLIAGLPHDRSASVLPFEWQHLWFLFALLAYQAVAYCIAMQLPKRAAAQAIRQLHALGQVRVLMLLAGMSLVIMVAVTSAVMNVVPVRYQPMLLELRLIAGYLPLYLLGMALANSRALRVALLDSMRIPSALMIVTAGAYLVWRLGISPDLPRAGATAIEAQVRFLIGALCPPAAVLLVLSSGLRIRRAGELVQRLCAASFTIYIAHYPLVIAANLVAWRADYPPLLGYAVIVLGVGAISYAIHALVVRRSLPAGFLLNGAWRWASGLSVARLHDVK